MTRVYLIRHGRVKWNVDDAAYAGWTDTPLDETGVKQAEQLAYRLKDIDISAVYSSDMSRAVCTASEIACTHGLQVEIIPELREINYGEWEKVTRTEIRRRWGDFYDRWLEDAEHVQIPGGETLAEVRDRALPAVERIVADHPDQTVAFVAHKTVNRMLICHWLDMDISRYREIGQYNSAVNIVKFIGNRVVIETVNDVCHLRR